MKIVVKDIINGGLDLHEKLMPETIGFENRDDFTLLTPISADAHIEKVSGLIVARVNLKADYRSFCARCLEDLELKWKDHYIFDYPYKDGEQPLSPIYPSLMNYRYSYGINNSPDQINYSYGIFSGTTLNENDMSEFYANYSLDQFSFLSALP